MLTNPKDIPSALVNIAVGIIVGLIARKWKFNFKTAIVTGLILAVIAPLIGTPIATYVYGGITDIKNDYEILGIIGINESPTCGIIGETGIFMEELISMLDKENIMLNLIDVPSYYYEWIIYNKVVKLINILN